jgi:hypothetical protein
MITGGFAAITAKLPAARLHCWERTSPGRHRIVRVERRVADHALVPALGIQTLSPGSRGPS